MCAKDDSHLTYNFKDHYVIYPSTKISSRIVFGLNNLNEKGKIVEQGFEYSSETNPHFLTMPELLNYNKTEKLMIPYSRQLISEEDIKFVNKVLRFDYLTTGPIVDEFEKLLVEKFKCQYSTVVNSATSALHVSCLAMGLSNKDILWTVPNTFVATANCAIYCGAQVDFVDIDESTSLISINELKKLEIAKKFKKLPKILIPVHLSGQPTLQEEIYKLSLDYGFKIIEDASHSVGGSRNNQPVGNCKWSHATIFSFHPVKIITSGEGGSIMSNDKDFDRKCKMIRSNGITKDKKYFTHNEKGPWYYEQQRLGYNYKLSDIHCALGVSQLKKLLCLLMKGIELQMFMILN